MRGSTIMNIPALCNTFGILAVSAVWLIATTGPCFGAEPDGSSPEGWHQFRGPFQNGSGIDCGSPLIDDITQAKLVLKNDEVIWCADNVQNGFASPILAKGTLYLSYYRGDGEVVPEERYKIEHPKMDAEQVGRANSIGAEDCLIAVDAATGKTRWVKRFPGSINLNSASQKVGGHFQSCYGNGKVFFYGPSARVHCVDAVSGERLWTGDLGPLHQKLAAELTSLLEQKESRKRIGRGSFHFAPIHAADVFVCGDGHGGLLAFDEDTGSLRWTLAHSTPGKKAADRGDYGNPIRWRNEGKDYIIALGSATVLLEAATGKQMWKSASKEGPRSRGGTSALAGDLLVTNNPSSCWRLTTKGLEKKWECPLLNYQHSSVLVYHDHVWLFSYDPEKRGSARRLSCVDLMTGKTLDSQVTLRTKSNGSAIAADGKIFYSHPGVPGKRPAKFDTAGAYGWGAYLAKPGHQKVLGHKFQGIANSVSPVIHRGYLYLRLTSGLACYDLRAR